MANNHYVFIAVCALMVVGELQSQTVRTSHTGAAKAEFEATCVGNIPAVRSMRTDYAGRSALQSLASCPDTGAALVAERWRVRPSDSTYMVMLQQVSSNINDERIADAAIDIFEDRAAPELLRRRALETVATQISPTFYIRLGEMKAMRGSTGMILSSLDVGSPAFFLAGRREITPESRARYEERLLAVADRDTALTSRIRTILKMAGQARRLIRIGGLSDPVER